MKEEEKNKNKAEVILKKKAVVQVAMNGWIELRQRMQSDYPSGKKKGKTSRLKFRMLLMMIRQNDKSR